LKKRKKLAEKKIVSFSKAIGVQNPRTAFSSCGGFVGEGSASGSFISGISSFPTINPYHPEPDDDEDWSDAPAPDDEEEILGVKE
jgi:hypothetical protein